MAENISTLSQGEKIQQSANNSIPNKLPLKNSKMNELRRLDSSTFSARFEHRRHTSVAMNRNYSETSQICIPADKNNKAIILDVGGKKHKIRMDNFNIYPNTRLGKLVKAKKLEDILDLCDDFCPGQPTEYFFDRSWHSFNSILDIYRTGLLHLNNDMCALVLQKDLEYWQIDELILEPCCALKYYPEIELCVKEQKGEQEAKAKEAQRLKDEDFGNSRIGRLRSHLWNVMEYPETSRTAQMFAWSSLGVVLLSTFTFVLGTFPEFQGEEETGQPPPYPEAVLAMEVVENCAVLFFVMEYIVRFVCSPRKWRFFKQPMNLVDFFAIIPFLLDLVIGGLQDFEIMGKAGKIVRLVRVMRVMRIFKLVRHFAGLQSLIYTLNQAYKELGLLMLLVGVAVLTFASLVYFAEKDNPAGSWSFLDSFWWGLMTLTTVGYGELSPSTFPGKLIGGLCALCGIFILTLPIPIVVNSFASYYKNRLWRNEVAYKKRERAQKRKEMEVLMKDNLLNILTVPGTPIRCSEEDELGSSNNIKGKGGNPTYAENTLCP
ncbi:potassium voltage-gated channel subfamily B member 2 isoform X2 [Eurytemora carolleeae]|uniref:potassium voltage-gated channel subfamily B member 2 isoform X2 n=1 Tax=Eurytemora carolleeae TaxID=1294199 RepID=UPI000C783A23|nr:potassium voltage-gated channel subfamily B member 2 isoform X2 [Eurytemora carolleeae]|eukprot:XP_023328465.1 potassium voltage-gated channel subfamily B member 2-like isoform X2 [Eurytemora affinis]